MEEEAEYLNRKKKTKRSPALPLFTEKEAEESLKYFHKVPYHEKFILDSNFSFEFRYAGHILGAASVIVQAESKKIGFRGDVG